MRMLKRLAAVTLVLQLAVAALLAGPAAAATVVTGKYKLPASLDTTVSTALMTELWAQVWRPASGGPFPLVVMLHGNHATCGHFVKSLGARIDDDVSYTYSGTCPTGYVVVPSHMGYTYLAKDLASRGYIVVSINANRGVNAAPGQAGDGGLNLVRGRLVLRHLQQLAQWNSGASAPPASLGFGLRNKIDFGHVGLMGHSRGGEGMRAAIAQYKDGGSPWPARIGPVTFEGLFEIGPVDGQTSRILNAGEVAWNVLLPGCDGDVSDLEGVKPFDRMMQNGSEAAAFNKSDIQVFGANHNFYNTQWQFSDASGCDGQTALFPDHPGSARQRATAQTPIRNFFKANVGPAKKPAKAQIFDPSYPLPTVMTDITRYSRGFTPTPQTAMNLVVDDFGNSAGTSSGGFANQSSGLTGLVNGDAGFSHDSTQRAASVDWSAAGGYLQVNASASGTPVDVSAFATLEFRVGLRCFGSLCNTMPAPSGDVDFSIQIANSNATFSSSLALKSYAAVYRPVGSFSDNEIMQTVRIPLSAFTGADLALFHGVRFTFDKTSASSIYLANVRLDKTAAGPGGLAPAAAAVAAAPQARTAASRIAAADVNQIVATRHLRIAAGPDAGKDVVEIELRSSRAFPVSDALPVLRIGTQSFRLSRFAGTDLHRLIFTLTPEDYATIPDGAAAEVRTGGKAPWQFGAYRKR